MKTFKEYLEENIDIERFQKSKVRSINTDHQQHIDGINARKLVHHQQMADSMLQKAKGEKGGHTHTKDKDGDGVDIRPVAQVRDFKTGKALPSHNPHVTSAEYMTAHRLHKKAAEAHQKHGPESKQFRRLDRVASKYSWKLLHKEHGRQAKDWGFNRKRKYSRFNRHDHPNPGNRFEDKGK